LGMSQLVSLESAETGAVVSLQQAREVAFSIRNTEDMKKVAQALGKDIPEINEFAIKVVKKKQALGRWYKSLPNASGKRNDLTSSQRCDEVLNTAKAQKETNITRQSFSRFVAMANCPDKVLERYKNKANEEKVLVKEVLIETFGREISKDEVTEDMAQVAVERVINLEKMTESNIKDVVKDLVRSVKDAEALEAAEAAMQEVAPVDSGVQAGQFWKLGDHILYCGDTSGSEFVDFLSALPQKATFAFADPPYGAEVDNWDSEFYWQHDYLQDAADVVAVTPGIVSIFEFARMTKMTYHWSHATWITNGMTRGALGFGNWIYTALFAENKRHLGTNQQDFFKVTIDNSETSETSHRGRKPMRLITELLHMFSGANTDGRDALVLDPFAGSGTTLLASESAHIPCITGEISPEYCQNIIARWEKMSSKNAEVM